jgi:HK97 family phage prohead protease
MPDTLKLADVDRERSKRLAQRMHVKQDEITIVRKGYEVKTEDANDAERTIVARVSTADRDRDGEIVEPKGIEFKDYNANPVLLWAHNYSQPAIGKALWSKTDDKGLVCKFQFAPTQFADEIYQLYKGGYQRAFSIGFIPVEFDQQTKTHKKISLLEVSAVPVPANQSALVMEAYAKGIVKCEGLIKDLEIDVEPEAEPDVVPAPEAEAPALQVAPEPEVKSDEPEAPVAEATAAEPLTLNIDISEFEAKMDAIMVKLDAIEALWDEVNKVAPATPVPPIVPAPALDVDPSPDIEIEEPAKPADVIEIELKAAPADDPLADIAAILKSDDFRFIIRDEIKLAIAKAQGKLL